MKVTRFHHVSLNCNGAPLDEMVDFYREVLGLGNQPRPEIPGIPGHWHSVGDQELHLVGAPPSGPGIDPTGHHFCVAVDDLDAAITELDQLGIDYLRAVQGEGTVQIWITDPSGNTIELQQDRNSSVDTHHVSGCDDAIANPEDLRGEPPRVHRPRPHVQRDHAPPGVA